MSRDILDLAIKLVNKEAPSKNVLDQECFEGEILMIGVDDNRRVPVLGGTCCDKFFSIVRAPSL